MRPRVDALPAVRKPPRLAASGVLDGLTCCGEGVIRPGTPRAIEPAPRQSYVLHVAWPTSHHERLVGGGVVAGTHPCDDDRVARVSAQKMHHPFAPGKRGPFSQDVL